MGWLSWPAPAILTSCGLTTCCLLSVLLRRKCLRLLCDFTCSCLCLFLCAEDSTTLCPAAFPFSFCIHCSGSAILTPWEAQLGSHERTFWVQFLSISFSNSSEHISLTVKSLGSNVQASIFTLILTVNFCVICCLDTVAFQSMLINQK